ncbi:MAG TPA: glycosyltransferase [Geminicoccaceae bacterium]
MNHVVCMKWGAKYPPAYVNTLYAMVRRQLEAPFRFLCLTDDRSGIRPEVECRDLPAIELGGAKPHHGWRKFSMFSPELHDLDGPILFLDLDLVLIDRLDPFFSHPGRFCIIENWTQPGRGIGNSSVFRFQAGDFQGVFERFEREAGEAVAAYPNSQTFLSHLIEDKTWWPETWCRSFKHHCMPHPLLRPIVPPRPPEGTRIVVFHGDPKPPEAADGVWPGKRRIIRPAPWIADHWRDT